MPNRNAIRYSVGTSCIAIVNTIVSFAIDLNGHSESLGLFSRSGALLVVTGVVLEYQLGIGFYLRKIFKEGGRISLKQLGAAFLLSDFERHTRALAHNLIGFGTIIWSYGDLIFKWL